MSNIIKIDSNDTLSEIAIHNGVVYLAGQVPNDDSLDIKGQSREVFANIDAALAKAGTDKSKILSAQVFITDLANFADFNEEWNNWVKGTTPPARATIEAKLVNPNWLVEIMVIAAV
ncbi:Enamine deaminase RidA, house cleaning of reactive enamine intermediates, YjgF/YER057c/UK114 family [Moraxella cuniculi DSM 21768]|uniref:Enamine deaminase RidA, house cleaning of reactive enamine intermediates, YjgF/YER057c/UK114 family n=2 Tax=Moraxella cuniculi TaxID=34061 RepID=A0A1N7DW84_9GAMM|nr:RidA family protein [Moraxella cuniculi]OOS07386.1 hypothetical protein B0189_02875 [Moraxella cuniculi]SIR80084.1 Enamine deaminase RidA, house cleaning of reactive enamine intermediates, YjgF/YER057c/UK114 family [Moraxella cuniculi DSM 21768]VEG12567.1 Enamine/imine deaminase [Moraxella cuniculi]